MKISRRDFVKSSALVGSGILLNANKLLRRISSEDYRFNILRNNVGIFTENGGSIGWYIDDDALVIIDTQFPESVQHLINELRKKTSREIDWVFNTHHHGDHTSGNTVLKPLSKHIAANENCVRLQKEKYGTSENIVYADITFGDKYQLDLGKEKITAFHFEPAHTGGDTVIHFENENVAHIGDLVFNRVYPWYGSTDGGSLKGWINYLEKIYKKFDDDTLFIFGHGLEVTGYRNDLHPAQDYLYKLVDFVEKEIAEGKSFEQIVSAKSIPGVNNLKEAWEGALKANLTEAYKDLSR